VGEAGCGCGVWSISATAVSHWRLGDYKLDIREGVVRLPKKRIMGWRRRALVAFIVRCDVV
jgi:hypothetical protein